jgi:hypothetical protein
MSVQSTGNRAYTWVREAHDGILGRCKTALAVLYSCRSRYEEDNYFFGTVVAALAIFSGLTLAFLVLLPPSHVP